VELETKIGLSLWQVF